MRVTLTKDYRKIAVSYGLIQNLSGDSNIELTESVNSDGIILKPFQAVTINRTVYARKTSGSGTGVLAILPFEDAQDSEDGDASTATDDDTAVAEEIPSHKPKKPPHIFPDPYACFEHEHFPKQPPYPPPKPFDGHRPPPPPHDDHDGYVIKIPRELVERGQSKFVVDFSH